MARLSLKGIRHRPPVCQPRKNIILSHPAATISLLLSANSTARISFTLPFAYSHAEKIFLLWYSQKHQWRRQKRVYKIRFRVHTYPVTIGAVMVAQSFCLEWILAEKNHPCICSITIQVHHNRSVTWCSRSRSQNVLWQFVPCLMQQMSP